MQALKLYEGWRMYHQRLLDIELTNTFTKDLYTIVASLYITLAVYYICNP
jgi:hypothetical protein